MEEDIDQFSGEEVAPSGSGALARLEDEWFGYVKAS